MHTFHGCSLAHPKRQHPCSCALALLLSERRIAWTTVHLITKMATKWLMSGWGRWCMQGGHLDKGDFCPGAEEPDRARCNHATHSGTWFKTCDLFISEIFYLILSFHYCLWVTETVESSTADRGRLYIGKNHGLTLDLPFWFSTWDLAFVILRPDLTQDVNYLTSLRLIFLIFLKWK